MFKVAQKETYWWPVTVELPVDGGKREKHTFDAEYKRLSQERLDELAAAARDGQVEDAKLASEILVGWKGIVQDEAELPFSEDARTRVFSVPGVRAAVIKCFFESVGGARAKN